MMDELPPEFPASPPPLPRAQRAVLGRPRAHFVPAEGQHRRSGFSLLLLIVACVALGMALNWGMKQRALASRLAGKMDVMQTQLALTAAADSDLTMLLASEASERVRLQAESPEARGEAAVVWDRKLGKGMLFCQALWPAAGGQRYHLWLGSAAGESSAMTMVATFDARPDSTVVRFHAPEVEWPVRFVISAGPEGATAPDKPLFSGRGS